MAAWQLLPMQQGCQALTLFVRSGRVNLQWFHDDFINSHLIDSAAAPPYLRRAICVRQKGAHWNKGKDTLMPCVFSSLPPKAVLPNQNRYRGKCPQLHSQGNEQDLSHLFMTVPALGREVASGRGSFQQHSLTPELKGSASLCPGSHLLLRDISSLSSGVCAVPQNK